MHYRFYCYNLPSYNMRYILYIEMETEDYHFKFRIVLLGEKSVGKSTFLDVLANNFGKIVEQEVSEELNIKVNNSLI